MFVAAYSISMSLYCHHGASAKVHACISMNCRLQHRRRPRATAMTPSGSRVWVITRARYMGTQSTSPPRRCQRTCDVRPLSTLKLQPRGSVPYMPTTSGALRLARSRTQDEIVLAVYVSVAARVRGAEHDESPYCPARQRQLSCVALRRWCATRRSGVRADVHQRVVWSPGIARNVTRRAARSRRRIGS